MSIKSKSFLNKFLIAIILSLLIIIPSITPIKVKVNEKQRKYCFTKTIFNDQDSLKIYYLITSGKKERLDITLKEKITGRELYREHNKQSGEYQTPLINSGNYEMCLYPQSKNTYYISFEMSSQLESGVLKDLAKDKELKEMEGGVLNLEKLFEEFEKNLNFIVDRRNHHTSILKEMVESIKIISSIKILVLIVLSVFQIVIIRKFFGKEKRVSKIKAKLGDSDIL